jgi:hypothetical protein
MVGSSYYKCAYYLRYILDNPLGRNVVSLTYQSAGRRLVDCVSLLTIIVNKLAPFIEGF